MAHIVGLIHRPESSVTPSFDGKLQTPKISSTTAQTTSSSVTSSTMTTAKPTEEPQTSSISARRHPNTITAVKELTPAPDANPPYIIPPHSKNVKDPVRYTNTHNWDGSYPAPTGREGGVLPPSRVDQDGTVRYYFQAANGVWVSNKLPWEANASTASNPPSYLADYKKGEHGGVYTDANGQKAFLSRYAEVLTLPSDTLIPPPDLLPPDYNPKNGGKNPYHPRDPEGHTKLSARDQYIDNYESKWLPGMKVDGPFGHIDVDLSKAKMRPGKTNLDGTQHPIVKNNKYWHGVHTEIFPGETQLFSYTVNSGETVSLGAVGQGKEQTASYQFRVLDPNGKEIVNSPTYDSFRVFVKNPPGVYTIEITGASGDYPKDAKFGNIISVEAKVLN